MPFGKFRGESLNQCPGAYLVGLLKNSFKLDAKLHRAIAEEMFARFTIAKERIEGSDE